MVIKSYIFEKRILLFLILMTLSSMSSYPVFAQIQQEERANVDIRALLEAKINKVQQNGSTISGENINHPAELARFYNERNYLAVWSIGFYFPERSHLFQKECIEGTMNHGLVPEDYHNRTIKSLLQRGQDPSKLLPVQEVLDLEILLTDAYFSIANHFYRGKLHPDSIGVQWHLATKKKLDPVKYLQIATSDNNKNICTSLQELLPQNESYWDLVDALKHLRQSPQWSSQIPGDWNTLLQKGDFHPLVEDVRRRLQETGDLKPGTISGTFDRELELAVMRFQRRHGMHFDGLIRLNTLQKLNISSDNRIQQIYANLERWRWMPENLGNKYIMINIPEFKMEVIQNNDVLYRELVVVGRENFPTPCFSDSMKYVIFNPYWNIPRSIVVDEILKQLEYDSTYLEKNEIEVLRGGKVSRKPPKKWTEENSEKYFFRQRAGELNPMGIVKFMFPNKYDIYLHDTPEKHLFNNSRRSNSHGCIRLHNPIGFADYILDDYTYGKWDTARIHKVLVENKETKVDFEKALPIHITYWTVFTDHNNNNELNFREDIYKWDEEMYQALKRPRVQ